MKKRAFWVLCLLLLFAFSSVSVSGATSNNSRIIDAAGVLSSSENKDIENLLSEASSKLDMDVVIITVDSIPDDYSQWGDDASEKYADDLFDYNGYSNDGILLLVSVGGGEGNRDYAFSTKGSGISTFNDSALDSMAYDVVSYMKNNDYYNGFKTFAETAAKAKDFKFGMWSAIAAALGGIVGAIRSGSLKSQLKSVYSKDEAKDYIKQGSFILNKKYDIPTYKTVSRTHIERSSSSGSTTHTSSSGTTHGGTHGKF